MVYLLAFQLLFSNIDITENWETRLSDRHYGKFMYAVAKEKKESNFHLALQYLFTGVKAKEATTTKLSYDYAKLMDVIAEKESGFQCQIRDPYNVTYGKYQVMPNVIHDFGYTIPMTCEEQDELMLKLIKMYEEILDVEKYEMKYYKGVLLHKTNLLIAMHFAPYGTVRYLETGVDFSNSILSVSGLLKRYENMPFYKIN